MRPSLFLSHGTPWLLIEENSYTEFLKDYASKHEKPAAIVILSSFWSRSEQAVSAVKEHKLSYDFTGFPEQVYNIKYPAKGNIELSDNILTLLSQIGILADYDETRPLDFGAWLPLYFMYPDNDIPVISLSINPSLSFEKQYEIGKSLSLLKKENVLIIASGGIVYNLQQVQFELGVVEGWAYKFLEWVEQKVEEWNIDELSRFYEEAPYAHDAVPFIDELVPLLICMGTADEESRAKLLHKSFQFGNISLTAWEF